MTATMEVDPKKLAKVIKEGGKRGVEIEGAADMGGLQFFCTKVDEPEGNVDLLIRCVEAMNAQADPEDEERKGCSGHIGKMVFSCDDVRLIFAAYVPEDKQKEITGIEWVNHVAGLYQGTFVKGDNGLAVGGNFFMIHLR
jgi:hypothetical protein